MNTILEDTADDWKVAWKPLVALIGQDLSDGGVTWGADLIEPGAIRRYLQPLEFDCPLHYDRETARSHGFKDVTAPYTSMGTFGLAAHWRPGEPLFTNADSNAQPSFSPLRGIPIPTAPPTAAFFATDYSADYLRPLMAGDRLGRRGNRLIHAEPKATRVGQGAFTLWEYEMVNQHLEVVARCRIGFYHYNPVQRDVPCPA